MNIFEPHKSEGILSDKISTESVIPDKQEYKFIASIPHKAGMRLFSFNPENGDIKEVKLNSKAALTLEGMAEVSHEAQYDPRLRYVQAINKRNAERKFKSGKYLNL